MSMSLIDAICNENYKLADQLITNGCYIDDKDTFGNTLLATPLMLLSVRSENKVCHELMIKLIDAGADVNIQNNNGYTALMLVSCFYFGDTKRAHRTLIDAGTNLDIKDKYGSTALSYSVKYRVYSFVDEVKMLIEADF